MVQRDHQKEHNWNFHKTTNCKRSNESVSSFLDSVKSNTTQRIVKVQYNELSNYSILDEFISVLTTENCPDKIVIDIKSSDVWNNIISLNTHKLIQHLLLRGKCKDGSMIYIKGTKMGDEGAAIIASAMENGFLPERFTLALCDNMIGNDGIIMISKAIAHKYCALSLTLRVEEYNGYGAYTTLIKALLTSISVIQLDIFDSYEDFREIIIYCCHRNRLMAEYPDFANHIKMLSFEAGLFHHHFSDKDPYAVYRMIKNVFPPLEMPDLIPNELKQSIYCLKSRGTEAGKILPRLFHKPGVVFICDEDREVILRKKMLDYQNNLNSAVQNLQKKIYGLSDHQCWLTIVEAQAILNKKVQVLILLGYQRQSIFRKLPYEILLHISAYVAGITDKEINMVATTMCYGVRQGAINALKSKYPSFFDVLKLRNEIKELDKRYGRYDRRIGL